MNGPRIASLVAALVLAAPFNLLAQQAPIVARGARVRVRAPSVSRDRLVGTVVEMGTDTCVLEVEDWAEPLALPLASLETLEVSRGTKSNAGKGAFTGGAVGWLFGLALGARGAEGADEDDPHVWGLVEGQGDVWTVAAIGGGVGATVGLLIGEMTRSDRWEEVPLDRLRVVPTRDRRGLALSVSMRL